MSKANQKRIDNAKKEQRVSDMVHNLREDKRLGPYANMISLGDSEEAVLLDNASLNVNNLENILRGQLSTLKPNDEAFLNDIIDFIADNYTEGKAQLFSNTFTQFEKKLRASVRGGTKLTTLSFIEKMKEHIKPDKTLAGDIDTTTVNATAVVNTPSSNPLKRQMMYQFTNYMSNPTNAVAVLNEARSLFGKPGTKARSASALNILTTLELRQLFDVFFTAEVEGFVDSNPLQRKKPISGNGTNQTNIDSRYYVDEAKLNNGYLAVKYKSNKRFLQGMSPQQVSNSQVEVIRAILVGRYNDKAYNQLKSEEKKLIKDFVTATKAKGVSWHSTRKEDLKAEIRVHIGSINSGNDSQQLRYELKEKVIELQKLKGITNHEALSILANL